MFKIIYLPEAKIIPLPLDVYITNSKSSLLYYLDNNVCYKGRSGALYFLSYDKWVYSPHHHTVEIPRHLLEVVDV